MTPDLFWIPGSWPGRLAITARPRGGDWLADEVRGWRDAHVDVVVSLLEEDEETQLELRAEGALSAANGIQFISLPIPDRRVPPSVQSAGALLRTINRYLGQGKNVAVHCRQGIGRSALIASGALMLAGMDFENAVNVVGTARGFRVPETPEQRQWLQRVLPDYLAPAA